MMQVIQDNPDSIDNSIQKKVMDIRLFIQVRDLAEQLRPIAISLDRAQSDTTTLADAYDIMKRLMNETVFVSHRNAVKKRKD